MELHLLENRNAGGYVSFGTCYRPGEVKEPVFLVRNKKGEPVTAQNEAAAFWPDGSIKWARHTADSTRLGTFLTVDPVGKEEALEPAVRLHVREEASDWRIDAGTLSLTVPKAGGSALAEHICANGILLLERIEPVFLLERREGDGGYAQRTRIIHGDCRIDAVEMETAGPVIVSVKYAGVYFGVENLMPFSIRMLLGQGSRGITFENTFFYSGEETRDFVKGMGICFKASLTGAPWNRHIQFGTDAYPFHETSMYLYSYHPRTPIPLRERQMRGELIAAGKTAAGGENPAERTASAGCPVPGAAGEAEEESLVREAAKDLPVWNRYVLAQTAASAYSIRKQTKTECCLIDSRAGKRAPGSMAVSGENGTVLIGIRDFWQRFPSGLEADGLAGDSCRCYAWFYAPQAEAMDYRHYDTRSYMLSNYEGFDFVGADASGTAVTCECCVELYEHAGAESGWRAERIVCGEAFDAFTKWVRKPAVYVMSPETYREKGAFGVWSLPCAETPEEARLEELLAQAFAFYKREIEERSWYGLFDYGDVMHSYDEVRHCWKYDFGGCAWQNTELVPTYWLWLYFLRTGREDVFTLAAAMSRHASETDVYHFGPKKGIGSRHNVRHWGCSCKEPRVSMAGHHRPLYYLTGDRRLGDYFDEVVSAAVSLQNLRYYHENLSPEGEPELRIRTGPDWAAIVSDWMTAYERTGDKAYRDKILAGIRGILQAPMRLGSGPSFAFDPETGAMRYRGEMTQNIHLTLCMGGPQIWMEAAEALDLPQLYDFMEEYGRLYLMTDDERRAAYGSLTDGKQYGMAYVAAGIAAFSAQRIGSRELARRAWETLMDASPCCHNREGFVPEPYGMAPDGSVLYDIPWNATNYTSQWCLNVIMALAMIREELPGQAEWDRRAEIPHSIPK